jgi:hypothetical protein
MGKDQSQNAQPEARATNSGEIHLILVLEIHVVPIRNGIAAAGRVVTLDFGKNSCITDGQECEQWQNGCAEIVECDHAVAFWVMRTTSFGCDDVLAREVIYERRAGDF